MSRHHETEIKLEARNPPALRRRLRELRFRAVQARHFESNAVFDFSDQRLWKAHRLLRLRLAGGQWTLTLKAAPDCSHPYKVRRETDIGIEEGSLLPEVLETLGLREAFRYEKYRTVYARGAASRKAEGPTLVYDETPIGDYLELEGPRRWIDQVARELGYARKDYITASYGSLYRQRCQARGVEPGNMVFATRKS
jgi:adenylate cyclase class 2